MDVVYGRVPRLLGEGGVILGGEFAEADGVIVGEDGRGDLGCKAGDEGFDEAGFQSVDSDRETGRLRKWKVSLKVREQGRRKGITYLDRTQSADGCRIHFGRLHCSQR